MKPLNKMTQEELFQLWKRDSIGKISRQNKINEQLLSQSAETLQLVKRICRHLGIMFYDVRKVQ